jgi:hypothetical protein
MARQVATPIKGKGRNGEGEGITLRFDQQDKTERRALQMSKLLASKHGRRKQAIVALLATMMDIFEESGEILDAREITARLNGIPTFSVSSSSRGAKEAFSVDRTKPNARSTQSRETRKEPLVTVAKESAKTTAESVAKNFLATNSGFWD